MTAGLRKTVAVLLVAAVVAAPGPAHAYLKFGVEIGGQVVPNQIVLAVLAFFTAWLATLVGVTLLLALWRDRRGSTAARG